jgi:hypothetical protein
LRALTTLRVLLPSWRFFDDAMDSLTLWVRCAAPGAELGPWRTTWHHASRGAGALFVNPHGNLALAHHSLLERLLSDVADLDDRLETSAAATAVEQLVSYRLVTRLAVTLLPAEAVRFQYKLTLVSDVDGQGERAEDVLISKVHET